MGSWLDEPATRWKACAGELTQREEKRRSMRREVEPEWLSIQELMTLTGLGRTKCYEMVAAGEFEAIKAGGAVRISKVSYVAWTRRNVYAGESR